MHIDARRENIAEKSCDMQNEKISGSVERVACPLRRDLP
jgi:hypothetical protein